MQREQLQVAAMKYIMDNRVNRSWQKQRRLVSSVTRWGASTARYLDILG